MNFKSIVFNFCCDLMLYPLHFHLPREVDQFGFWKLVFFCTRRFSRTPQHSFDHHRELCPSFWLAEVGKPIFWEQVVFFLSSRCGQLSFLLAPSPLCCGQHPTHIVYSAPGHTSIMIPCLFFRTQLTAKPHTRIHLFRCSYIQIKSYPRMFHFLDNELTCFTN